MYPRTEFKMTEEDLKMLLDSCQPVLAMKVGNLIPSSQQENINRAWKTLGTKMGFVSTTVQPVPGKESRYFSAVPCETLEQKEAREEQEAKEIKAKEVAQLRDDIAQKKERLKQLEGK